MLQDYQSFVISAHGAGHQQKGTPMEDWSGMDKSHSDYIIGVVSDGHGDPACMRSSIGSQIAVDITLKHLNAWAEKLWADAPAGEAKADAQPEADPQPSPDPQPEADVQAEAEQKPAIEVEIVDIPVDMTAAAGLSSMEEIQKSDDIMQAFYDKLDDGGEAEVTDEAEDTAFTEASTDNDADDEPEECAEPAPAARELNEAQWEEKVIRELCRTITLEWKKAVLQHLQDNPLSEKEIQEAGRYRERYLAGQHLEHIYGATLLAGLMTDERMLLIQKGDGHATFVYEDGMTSTEVVPWDPRCELNVTTSLCNEDSATTWEYAAVDLTKKPQVAAVFLASDGLEDCFPDDMKALGAYVGRTAVTCAVDGVEALMGFLEGELDFMSKNGSRDDISVMGFVNVPKILPLKRYFSLLDERYREMVNLKDAETRLASMQAGRSRATAQITQMQNELADLTAQAEQLNQQIQALSQQRETTKRTIKENPDLSSAHDAFSVFFKVLSGDANRARTSMSDYLGKYDELVESKSRLTGLQQRLDAMLDSMNRKQKTLNDYEASMAKSNARWEDNERARVRAQERLAQLDLDLADALNAPQDEEADSLDAFNAMMEE